MAEIKIEKKTPKWPWIIAILAILAVAIYFLAFNDDGDEVEDRQADTTEQRDDTRPERIENQAVAGYVTFIANDPDRMGLDHEFTNEALMKLTNATEAMSSEINYDISKDLEEVRKLSKKIKEDPYETTHANSIREAADILAAALQRMQQNAFPDMGSMADEVKTAASEIKPDVLTLEQKGEVKGFFRASADLLEKMNMNTPK
jgi:hypothetical protein